MTAYVHARRGRWVALASAVVGGLEIVGIGYLVWRVIR